MDETYIKVKGTWKYLYRAVDKEAQTVDFLLTARRDKAAAMRFFDKAVKANGVPEKVTMDKSGANKAAMDEINARGETPVIVRQVKYLNNIVEQAIEPSNGSPARSPEISFSTNAEHPTLSEKGHALTRMSWSSIGVLRTARFLVNLKI